jgi:hypothetical protein
VDVTQRVLAVLVAVALLLFAMRLIVRTATRRIGQILLALLALAGVVLYALWKFGLLLLGTTGR